MNNLLYHNIVSNTVSYHLLSSLVIKPGGGGLTDKWYTGMLKGFEVHFRKFWYIDGWVIVTYPMRPICKIGGIFENLAKEHRFAPNWMLFAENGIEMGHKITLFEV